MKGFLGAALSIALAAGVAGCSDQSPSWPDSTSPPESTLNPREQIVTRDLLLIWSDGSGAVDLRSSHMPSFRSGFMPSWSPDGSRLVFSTTQCETDWTEYIVCDRGGLVIMNPETGEVTNPESGSLGVEPAWAPTGDLIAFVRSSDGNLVLMPPDGSGVEERAMPPGTWDISNPSWSPDGNRIAFGCRGGTRGICVINRDGTGFVRLTTTEMYAVHVSPEWSPDGKTIAFTDMTTGTREIAVMATDGSAVTRITEGFTPAWSRDGKKLGFVRDTSPGYFTINVDGSNLTSVRYGYGGSAAWRP